MSPCGRALPLPHTQGQQRAITGTHLRYVQCSTYCSHIRYAQCSTVPISDMLNAVLFPYQICWLRYCSHLRLAHCSTVPILGMLNAVLFPSQVSSLQYCSHLRLAHCSTVPILGYLTAVLFPSQVGSMQYCSHLRYAHCCNEFSKHLCKRTLGTFGNTCDSTHRSPQTVANSRKHSSKCTDVIQLTCSLGKLWLANVRVYWSQGSTFPISGSLTTVLFL